VSHRKISGIEMASHANLPPVLVVDDNENDLFLIKRLLAKAGIKNPVVTFDDCVEAVSFIKAAAQPNSGLMPCAVITDLKMSGMNGMDFVEWIRSQKSLARLTVIMLSGSNLDNDVKRANALGVDTYLVKFPSPDVIARIVTEACQRSEGQTCKPLGDRSDTIRPRR
jgi:CheY-like chemotaxis protein